MDEVPAANVLPSGDPGATSFGLLQGVQAKEPEAWHRLVDLYGPLVYQWCRSMGVPADDVPDVVQETFVAAARNIEQFHHDKAGQGLRRWLWTITHNKVMDHFRRQQAGPRAEGGTNAQVRLAEIPASESDSSLGDHPADAGELACLARRAMELVRAEFTDDTWQAFWRITIDGQPAKTIAAELGMTLRAVYQAKYRVLQRIRQLLGPVEPGEEIV